MYHSGISSSRVESLLKAVKDLELISIRLQLVRLNFEIEVYKNANRRTAAREKRPWKCSRTEPVERQAGWDIKNRPSKAGLSAVTMLSGILNRI